MYTYNPDQAPNPTEWLALDEQMRISSIESYHHAARIDLPNAIAHALFHTIVENQIAMLHSPVIRAMARLAKQGLSRHDCLHAVASVLAQHIYDAWNANASDASTPFAAHCDAAIERLDAATWLSQMKD